MLYDCPSPNFILAGANMEEFKTLSTAAAELGWTVATLKYRLSKCPDIKEAHIQMGKHRVRILKDSDIEKLKKADQKG